MASETLHECWNCGARPYGTPQTCDYSRPGIVHRYRILCPSCKTQSPEYKRPEQAIAGWNRGAEYVPIRTARAAVAEMVECLERIAKGNNTAAAIAARDCLARHQAGLVKGDERG